MAEARQLAAVGYTRDPAAGPERQQLPRSVAGGLGLRAAAGRAWAGWPASGGCGSPRRTRATSSRRSSMRSSAPDAVQSRPPAGAVGLDPGAASHAAAVHARRVSAAHRVDEERRAAPSRSPPTSSWASPARPKRISRQTLRLLDQVEYDSIFGFKYSRRPNTPALALDDQMPEEEKIRRLAILQEQQRAIQIAPQLRLMGSVEEVPGGRIQQSDGAVDRADVAAQDAQFPLRRAARERAAKGRFIGALCGGAGDPRRAEFVGGRMWEL